MSNHLSKSLFSIPRLKKSRSRQQNQPENPTSLCLNALTADDAFLRFAAALDKTFFSPRNPKRNSIIFLCIPSLPRPFLSPCSPERNFIFNTAYPPSARPFSPLKSPKRNFIFSLCISPVCRAFFSPRAAPNGILFSHSTCILPPPRPEAPALHCNIFGLIGRLSPRGAQGLHTCRIHPTIVPEMRCAAPKRRNFPARKRYCRHKSGCRGSGRTRWIQEKNVSIGAAGDILYWDYRRGQGRQGI